MCVEYTGPSKSQNGTSRGMSREMGELWAARVVLTLRTRGGMCVEYIGPSKAQNGTSGGMSKRFPYIYIYHLSKLDMPKDNRKMVRSRNTKKMISERIKKQRENDSAQVNLWRVWGVCVVIN